MSTINLKEQLFTKNAPTGILRGDKYFKISVHSMGVKKEVLDAVMTPIKDMNDTAQSVMKGNVITAAIGVPKTLIDAGTGVIDLLGSSTVDKENATLIDYSLSSPLEEYYLPLPNSIKDTCSQAFDESSFNMEEKLARTFIGGAKSVISIYSDSLANSIPSIVELAERLSRRGNLTIDPNTLMTYAGSLPRTFTFEFILNPSSADEANYYNELIMRLKAWSLAERNENDFYGELGIRTLSIRNCFTFGAYRKLKDEKGIRVTGIDFINNILCSTESSNKHGGFYLSNIALIVGGQDSMQLYYDGTPKTSNLTLSFVERKPMFEADWKTAINKAKWLRG